MSDFIAAPTCARLAHVDLIPSSLVSHSVVGSFSAPDLDDEIAVSRGGDIIELVRVVNKQSWKVIHSEPVFGTIRTMACLPSPSRGTQQDCLVLTSDSGAVSVLKFNPLEHRFEVESQDFFGRSGIRRTVPGAYVAVEPLRGRALMVAALESTKLLYPIHHVTDAATGNVKTMLLSAIEVSRPASFTFALCALQDAAASSTTTHAAVSAESSSSSSSGGLICRFAAIESERGLGMRQVVIYEYDIALQNCNAVLSIPVVSTAPPSSLVPLPGNSNLGCSLGALVVICSPGDEQVHTLLFSQPLLSSTTSENSTVAAPTFSSSSSSSAITYEQIDSCVPRRLELSPEDNPMFMTGVYAQIKARGVFTLIQNELGDLYKVELGASRGEGKDGAAASEGLLQLSPYKVFVRYFDTLPNSLVAQSCVLLRTGVLAAFGENGANGVYLVKDVGPKDDSYLAKQFHVRTIVRSAAAAADHYLYNNNNNNNNSRNRDHGLLDLPSSRQLQQQQFTEHVITREVKQFVASPHKLRYLQPVPGAVCTGGAGPTSAPTLQMSLFPNKVFANLMATSSSTQSSSSASSALLQFNTKKFMSVRGKGYENSSVALVQFGHRADVVAEYNLPFAFESAVVLPSSNIFLLSSRSNNATLVFSSDKFEVLNSAALSLMTEAMAMTTATASRGPQQATPTGGFVADAATIAALELPSNKGVIQVHRNGLRHLSCNDIFHVIRSGSSAFSQFHNISSANNNNNNPQQHHRWESHDWSHHSGRKVQLAASNCAGQLLLSFEGGAGLILFEYSREVGAMRIEKATDTMDNITCLAVAPPISVDSKALLGAVGIGGNYRQLVFVWLVGSGDGMGGANNIYGNNFATGKQRESLQPASKPLGFHSVPVSVNFVQMGLADVLYAVIGLEDGTVVRIPVDPLTAYINEDVLENLTEIVCGDGPAQLVSSSTGNLNNTSYNKNTMNSSLDSVQSSLDKCCYAVSSGNVWRLSVQDRETHTQVPVTIATSTTTTALGGDDGDDDALASAATSLLSNIHDLSVWPIHTSKLPNGLLILNPAQRLLAAATLDVTSNFNETVLKKPATTFSPVSVASSSQHQREQQLQRQQQQGSKGVGGGGGGGGAAQTSSSSSVLLSSSKMIRRVMMSRDGAVGVVLENESKSRASIVSSLTRHNTLFLGQIRQREQEERDAKKKKNNNSGSKNVVGGAGGADDDDNDDGDDTDDDDPNDDDALFAPDVAALAGEKSGSSVASAGVKKDASAGYVTTAMLKGTLSLSGSSSDSSTHCPEDRSGFSSSWCIETFSMQKALRSGGKQQQQQQDQVHKHFVRNDNNSNNATTIFEPTFPNETATCMIVGKIKFASASASQQPLGRGYSFTSNSGGNNEQIVVATLNSSNVSGSNNNSNNNNNNDALASTSLLYTLSFTYNGHLSLLHKTVVEDAATALHILPTSRWLVVGCGTSISFYCSGRDQLLRKHHVADAVPNRVAAICSSEDEILCVADVHESIFIFKIGHQKSDTSTPNTMNPLYYSDPSAASDARPLAVLFADDFVPRHVTCCTFVDPATIAVGDRFGNISVLRFSYEAVAYANNVMDSAVASGSAGRKNTTAAGGGGGGGRGGGDDRQQQQLATFSSEEKRLKGAPRKLEEIARFFVGQTVVSLDREYQISASASSAAPPSTTASAAAPSAAVPLYYCTSTGKVGALLPLSEDDFTHLTRVEHVLRTSSSDSSSSSSNKYQPLLGRDHCSYRSSFGPVVGVVDVSFIEHVWRIAKSNNVSAQNTRQQQQQQASSNEVEAVIDSLVAVAQFRNESVGLPQVGARPLETGLSELHARAIGNVEI